MRVTTGYAINVLIDTSILLASIFPRDVNHSAAQAVLRSLRDERIIAAPVLPELFYIVYTRLDYRRAVSAFNLLRTGEFTIEALTAEDMARMAAIMAQYADNHFDYTDTAIMALAERLEITTIYTFDQRDFGAFRPIHAPYFDLLP